MPLEFILGSKDIIFFYVVEAVKCKPGAFSTILFCVPQIKGSCYKAKAEDGDQWADDDDDGQGRVGRQ